MLPRDKLRNAGANFRVVHVFVFNRRGELLIQRIARHRRHGGMWGSSVASYVRSGESYDEASARAIRAELGIGGIFLEPLGKLSMTDESSTKFIGFYRAEYEGRLTLDPDQVSAVRFVRASDRQLGGRAFTPTFLHLLDHYLSS